MQIAPTLASEHLTRRRLQALSAGKIRIHEPEYPDRAHEAILLWMSQAAHSWLTFDDYLSIEAEGALKHEFVRGQVLAMAGSSPAHARVSANITALLQVLLGGKPCTVFSSDLRVRVASDLASYPDVTVICGQIELDPADRKGHTVLNPRVLVEVLSPTTENYDRGENSGATSTSHRFKR